MRYSGVRCATAVAALALPFAVDAQSTTSCAAPSPSGSIRPSVASGYRLQVVATGLSRPRGILLDGAGNLLVVQAGSGIISAHAIRDTNGCVSLGSGTNVTGALSLNHGIEMSTDGRTLYASNSNEVYEWSYNAAARTVSNQVTLIENMAGTDHTTRTLLLSRTVPGMLSVSRGSTSNIDFGSASLDTGHSQVKAFNLSARGSNPYDFNPDGVRLGWGLRNDVGVAEHPVTGGIWSVENSADNINRSGVDVHYDNPAEELNFLGYLNGTAYAQQGGNFGYPWCFTAWDPSALPNNQNLTVGSQFAISPSSDSNNENRTDAYCAQQVAPRLSFQAHMAPLDIKFNNTGRQAWITFHGSWDRSSPVGYSLAVVNFTADGEPVDPATSKTAATFIVGNANNTACPGNCLRPVAMAIDPHGRIYMSSDSSGEIYLVTKDASSSGVTPSGTSSGTPTSTNSASPSSTSSAASAGFHLGLLRIAPYVMSSLMLLF